MKKLSIFMVVLAAIIVYQLYTLYSVNLIASKRPKTQQSAIAYSLFNLSSSTEIGVREAWRDLFATLTSTTQYKGILTRVEYNNVFDGIKTPLILTFNLEKKQIYFFSEQDLSITKFVLGDKEIKDMKMLNLKSGDEVYLTTQIETNKNNKKKLTRIILEKK